MIIHPFLIFVKKKYTINPYFIDIKYFKDVRP